MTSDADPWTVLHHAVTEAVDLAAVREALSSGVPVDEPTDDAFQATALHRAAGHGRLAGVIPLLIEAGADIEARNARGRTPLHLAYRYAAPDWVIEELRNAGADPDAIDDLGHRPEDLTDPANH